MSRWIAAIAVGLWLVAGGGASAQETVKLGQIEAQTGPNAIYGWMSSQGVPIAVDEINKAGGFQVGGKTYKLQLIAPDTRGDPKEATVQLKRLLEEEKVKFVFGPFLSNVFATIEPYAAQFDGKILMMGGATRIHEFLGKPGHDFLVRAWNWDVGPSGFGELMTDRVKQQGTKKIAILFQNDQGGKVIGDIYTDLFQKKGIEYQIEYFEPGTKDFSAVLAKLSAWNPDYLFPGYSDSAISDIVRQATEGNYFKRFFLVRGSLGPGLKNKDELDDYLVYVPKYFEQAEKTEPKVAKFVAAYKTFYKRDFPYDQAPLCSSACYDHVYMLVEAMKKAGTVDDVEAIRKALLSMTYDGLWKISFDAHAEQIMNFDIVHLKHGGAIEVTPVDPPR
ncbi:MAG: ABC transporter substrate-binding protein [Alphaproteobacteria bacterium]|nr:ABC transporter substrate-binding protein [Alphaproteobacteria bacterium]